MPRPSVAKLVTPMEVDVAEAQLALPAPEPVVEEAPLEVQEIQSSTLMNQDVLGELDPIREAVNVLGVVEGDEKEDAEDGKAASIV